MPDDSLNIEPASYFRQASFRQQCDRFRGFRTTGNIVLIEVLRYLQIIIGGDNKYTNKGGSESQRKSLYEIFFFPVVNFFDDVAHDENFVSIVASSKAKSLRSITIVYPLRSSFIAFCE